MVKKKNPKEICMFCMTSPCTCPKKRASRVMPKPKPEEKSDG
jgi:hypothetical protein